MKFDRISQRKRRALTASSIALAMLGATFLSAQQTPESSTSPSPEKIDNALGSVVDRENDSIATQSKIDSISDQTDTLESEYKSILRELEVVRSYNAQMEQIIDSQEGEISTIETDLSKLQSTQREILPLLSRMIDALDQFVEADKPFLLEERQSRVAELRDLMSRGDITIAEKYRKVFDAYQQENNLARNIEATTGQVKYKGQERTVEFLRIGRVALYLKSLDDQLIARWDEAKNDWTEVSDGSEKLSIVRAFKIARKELPVDLLVLPVAKP